MKLDKITNFRTLIEKLESNALLFRRKKWKILCLLTDLSDFNDLINSLKSFKYNTTLYGTVYKVQRSFKKEEISFKGYISQHNKLIYFFSNETKDDIEKYFVKKFLNKVKHFYYLWIPKIVIEDIINEFESQYDKLILTEFHTERDLLDNTDSYFRKNHERKLTYSGEDGLEAIKELRYYYGVRPYLVEFNILDKCSFRVNKDGFFIYNSGDLFFLIKLIEIIYEKVQNVVNLTKSSVFEEVLIKNLRIPTLKTQPIIIKFHNYQLNTENVSDFLRNLERFGFEAFNESIETGSILFNTDIIDSYKKAVFNLSSGGKELVITPQYNTTFDTLFRFIEILSENLDSELEYKPYTHTSITI